MNRICRLTVPALLLCLAAGCGKLDFKEYTSAQGKYSVLMPGTPKKETRPAGPLTLHFEMVENRNDAWGVGYADLPPGTPFDYEGAVKGMANANGGTVNVNRDFTLDGVKGREVEISITKPVKGYTTARIIVVNNRLYEVLAVGTKQKLDDPEVKKFFESFKVNK
jgi:hypothetical protein